MSVVGFDFGNDSCYISVARAGGIESIANDYSLRETPSYVAFSEKQRLIGVSAKSQHLTNLKRTFFGFKPLIGRKYADPIVQHELKRLPFKISEDPGSGNVLIHVDFLGKPQVFTPRQIAAMLFTKLKETAETALSTKVKDCVISVPVYYTEPERKCILDSASMADLHVLKLMNDTTATALAYGIYKQDLPALEEKARNVIFVDVGHRGIQTAACSFHKGKLSVVACAFEAGIGGRNFNDIIGRHMAADFKTKFKIDTYSNPKAVLKLLTEIEKLKKQMSANTNKLPLNIECFMDDKDVKGHIDRDTFEELAAPEFQRLEKVMEDCLEFSKWKKEDIFSVEVVGGSSRIPAIKTLIGKVFGKTPNTTLNADEAVSRGCALQCAILSPTFKVREFQVSDVQPYSIKLKWQEGDSGEMEVFPRFHSVPFSKMLTFYRRANFKLTAEYNEKNHLISDALIGNFEISEVKAQEDGSNQKVKVKARININGNFTIATASLIESVVTEVEEEVPMDTEEESQQSSEKKNEDDGQDPNMKSVSTPASNTETAGETTTSPSKETVPAPTATKTEKKKKVTQKTIELPISANVRGSLAYDSLIDFTNIERSLTNQDKHEAERLISKNNVEEYVYDIRSRINDDLCDFILEGDRLQFTSELDDHENWLYDDGENCEKELYVGKLKELKLKGEPVKKRKLEFDDRSQAINSLSHTLQMADKVVNAFKSGDENLSHLEADDVNKAEKLIDEKQRWLNDSINVLNNLDKTTNPPVLVVQFYNEKSSFETTVTPILMKPKPKVDPPEPTPTDSQPSANGEQEGNAAAEEMTSDESNEKPDPSKTMDVD